MMIGKYLVPFLLALILAGCFGDPAPVPQDAYYTLPQLDSQKTNRRFDLLLVDTMRASGVYNERAILYRDHDKPLNIKRYHYHHWVMPPAQMIQQAMKSYLVSNQIAGSVMNYRPGAGKGAVLRGTLLQFEQVLNGKQASVATSLELEFAYQDKRFVKRYTKIQSADNNSLEAAAAAFGKALESILKEFVADITSN